MPSCAASTTSRTRLRRRPPPGRPASTTTPSNEALRAFQPASPSDAGRWPSGRGVQFVDDSKATNPDAVIKALTAFDGGVQLILGGSLKGGSFAPLAAAVADGAGGAVVSDRGGG